jgi:tetratricopeptide (TPR) repeat protein
MAGEYATALNKYRAAITINACNAFAWAGMGEALVQLEEPNAAKKALRVATRLMPTHYQAWTNLGRAEEATGRTSEAAAAYEKALAAHPGHGPADEGLRRTRAR